MGKAWLTLRTVRKPVGWRRGGSLEMRLERQVEASWASVGSSEFILDGMGHHCGSLWPLCGSRLEAGVKSRPEMTEAWTSVMAAERKKDWI